MYVCMCVDQLKARDTLSEIIWQGCVRACVCVCVCVCVCDMNVEHNFCFVVVHVNVCVYVCGSVESERHSFGSYLAGVFLKYMHTYMPFRRLDVTLSQIHDMHTRILAGRALEGRQGSC